MNYWLLLILSWQWGWTGWRLRLLGDALSPTFLASFPRDPAVVRGGGGGGEVSNLPLPVREVTSQRNLSLNFLAPLPYSSATEFRGAEGKLASPHVSPSSAEML